MSAPLSRRRLGSTGITVTSLALGTSGLGGMPGLYGYDVDEERAVATVLEAFESPIRFGDTSNGYADAEVRIGKAIARRGGLPADFVLATKVDPAPGSSDFSGARVRQSLLESLDRLGLDRLPLVYLHDPERIGADAALAAGGPVEALLDLRDEGLTENIGVAGGTISVMTELVRQVDFDVVLTHSRHTILDRSANPLIDLAVSLGMGVVNAAPFAGGLLAPGVVLQPGYAHSRSDALVAERLAGLADACAEFGVPLAAAALQFAVSDERIDSTVVGMSRPERLASTIELLDVDVPTALSDRFDEFVLPPDQWLS